MQLSQSTLNSDSNNIDKSALGMPAEASLAKRLRTLCVDDNAMNLRILDRTLRHHFPSLIDHDALLQASDGFHALAQVASHAGTLDLVLLDIDMPGISGVQVAQQIRASQQPWAQQLILIACTTSDAPASRQKYAEVGMDGCVCKPIDLRALDAALRSGLARRRPDLRIIEEDDEEDHAMAANVMAASPSKSSQEKAIATGLSPTETTAARPQQQAFALHGKHFSLQQNAFPTLRSLSDAQDEENLSGVTEAVQTLMIQEDDVATLARRALQRRHSVCTEKGMPLCPIRLCLQRVRNTRKPLLKPLQTHAVQGMMDSSMHEVTDEDACYSDDSAACSVSSSSPRPVTAQSPFTFTTAAEPDALPLLDRTQSAAAIYTHPAGNHNATTRGSSTLDRFARAAKRRLPLRTRTPEILMQPASTQVAAL